MIALRPWTNDDAWLLHATLGNPAMMHHLGGVESAEQIERRHARFVSGREMFTVWDGDEVVGSVGFWESSWLGEDVYETGWMTLPQYAGRRIATKAALEIVGLARNEGKRRFLHAFPNVDNAASNAVCRNAGLQMWASMRLSIRKAIGCGATTGASTCSRITDARVTFGR